MSWKLLELVQPPPNVNIIIIDSHGGISITKTNAQGFIKYRSYRMKSKGSEYYMPRRSIRYWTPLDSLGYPEEMQKVP